MSTRTSLKDRVRGWFFDNFLLKLISLVCAVSFFAFIHGAERAQRTFALSIVSIMPPDTANRQLMTQLPNEVAVTLRGPAAQLDSLRSEDLGSVTLDLSHGQEATIHIDPNAFHVPPGMTVEQIFPTKIEVHWDDIVVRDLPVQIARAGEPADGFIVRGGITVEPETVNVRGPRSLVDVLQYARAEPFDVQSLEAGDYRRVLALYPAPDRSRFDVESVTATVTIAPELRTIEFAKLTVEVLGFPGAKTSPPQVDVLVQGTPEDLQRITEESIIPRVEVPDGEEMSKAGSAYLDVLVDVAAADSVVVSPRKVLVKWEGSSN